MRQIAEHERQYHRNRDGDADIDERVVAAQINRERKDRRRSVSPLLNPGQTSIQTADRTSCHRTV